MAKASSLAHAADDDGVRSTAATVVTSSSTHTTTDAGVRSSTATVAAATDTHTHRQSKTGCQWWTTATVGGSRGGQLGRHRRR